MSIARVATLEDSNTGNRWSTDYDDQTCSISTSCPIQTFYGASFATRTEMSRNCFGLRTELRTSRHPVASGMGRLAWGADSSHPTCDEAWRFHLVTLWKRRLETCIYLTDCHWFIIGSRDPIIRPSFITCHRSHDVTRSKTELKSERNPVTEVHSLWCTPRYHCTVIVIVPVRVLWNGL